MAIDFIKSKKNSNELLIASKQQSQLSYFTESKVQDDISIDYLTAWAQRKYRTNDYFLNFVKTVFKTDNFLLIYKYLRHPLPSARLINDKVKTPLKRVFYSEDPFFKYEIKGELVKHPDGLESEEFNENIFNALLFRHNDIMVVDLKDINSPFKTIISIDNVVALDSYNSVISRIAYSVEVEVDGKPEIGVLYIDSERYSFYKKEENGELSETPSLDIPHDLGRCPADYISAEHWSESEIIRKSMFSFVREELEEYVFLKTLQRMAEPSGAIPTVTMLKTGVENDDPDSKGSSDGEPMSLDQIQSQVASERSTVDGGRSIMQAGNMIEVPLIRKEDGSVEMDVVTNYLNFFYIPVESLNYISGRVKEIKASIISNVLGDYTESAVPQGSKSDLEAGINIVSRQDKLRDLSVQLSRIRTRSDYNWLALKFGKENVKNEAFYGSDFFLETQKSIYELIKSAPNPIEVKSLLIKSARNRNRFNVDNFTREFILYHLIPYGVKEDFDIAVKEKQVGDITFQYQTRFNYWIGLFESLYGDILTFWKSLNGTENEKVVLINNLITIIIRDNYEKSSASESVQGKENP